MAHDHHDHSNCNHSHGSHSHSHSHGGAKKMNDSEKLTKALVEIQELANEHKKAIHKTPSSEPVSKADVDLLIKEMQITKAEAESALRSNKNDVVAALTCLVSQ
ncbi:hypothetical protein BD408DRAFT_414001 [Parasitella parasitica]|nr:hypothetical protein BD408DRAFT_414001 [Parasitella parasitica]